MRTENKYPEVLSALTSGGAKGPKTIDLGLSHRITFGTATSYTDRERYGLIQTLRHYLINTIKSKKNGKTK